MLELIRMGTSMASLYIWLKRFSFDISYMKYSSDLSLGESFAYLPPFISLLNGFDFLSILNGVTLKTSNMFASLEIARVYKVRKLFADLQRPICYKDPQNKGINLIVYSLFTLWPKFGNRWISRIGSLRFSWNSVQRKALMSTICSREIFTKKCRQQQNFDSDPKEVWHYNYVTFTRIAKYFMLYCRLIYMLSVLYMLDLRSK